VRGVLILGVALLFSACASKRPQVEAAQAERVQITHDQQVDKQSSFALSGRIGIKNNGDGGSGSFTWAQNGDVIEFELRAPLSNQTWRLEGMPGSFELTDSKGKVTRNADAEQLLLDASGWQIPMVELRHWVRGARAPISVSGDATVQYSANGDLKQLVQNGWTVDFERFDDIDGTRLPIKLKAYQNQAQVKVLIKSWDQSNSKSNGQ
jgi:outer membrane lipoprotein LolB